MVKQYCTENNFFFSLYSRERKKRDNRVWHKSFYQMNLFSNGLDFFVIVINKTLFMNARQLDDMIHQSVG